MRHFGKQFTTDNFRCFRDKQIARLAPVTLLVGENSTGKTSFLALIRLMWKLVSDKQNPNFKEAPFDLGSFEDIVHHGRSRNDRSNRFGAEFLIDSGVTELEESSSKSFRIEASFERSGAEPVLAERRLSIGTNSVRVGNLQEVEDLEYLVQLNTANGALEFILPMEMMDGLGVGHFDPLMGLIQSAVSEDWRLTRALKRFSSDTQPGFARQIAGVRLMLQGLSKNRLVLPAKDRVFASAPVRSKPQRTYNPASISEDPEGQYVPMYLANISSFRDEEWRHLKGRMEEFGKRSGLFDEIVINKLGKNGGDPFQIQIRKAGRNVNGPKRNLIDWGYGVSQVLPLITELFRDDAAPISLLQQPEVHLHPRAQAALGTLFCGIAETGRQLIIETHSDYILDRIQIDIRKGRTNLKPEDVSILFFERQDLHVKIHSLSLDEDANLCNQPQSYREFFMKETNDLLELSED